MVVEAPRPPKAEPAKVEEKEPAPKEERAKFTVSTRGTLIWHEAKNVQPGAEGSTPAPFGTRRARPSEVSAFKKPPGQKFEFLTSLGVLE